jgi:dodecin
LDVPFRILSVTTLLQGTPAQRTLKGDGEGWFRCSSAPTPWMFTSIVIGDTQMNDHVYKTIELTGSSATGPDDAVCKAIERASQTVRQMRWFEVTDTRGHIENDRIAHWQVTVKIGFTLEE